MAGTQVAKLIAPTSVLEMLGVHLFFHSRCNVSKQWRALQKNFANLEILLQQLPTLCKAADAERFVRQK